MITEEMCDICKEVKPLEEISRMKAQLTMLEGVTHMYPVRAICKECDLKNVKNKI